MIKRILICFLIVFFQNVYSQNITENDSIKYPTTIEILEKHKISQKELDEQDLFLLELSVRKQIVNDTRGKVNKVLGIKEELPINNPDWWR